MVEYVAYYRASTDRQGASGLELDAQGKAVRHFNGDRGQFQGEYTEIGSGPPAYEPPAAPCRPGLVP